MAVLSPLRGSVAFTLRQYPIGLPQSTSATVSSPENRRSITTISLQRFGIISSRPCLPPEGSPALRTIKMGLGKYTLLRPPLQICARRGVATQATAATGITTASTASGGVPWSTTTSTPVLEPLDWLQTYFLPTVRPLVPVLDSLPTYIGLTPGTPYAYAISLVALALLLRTAITLPVALWQRGRTRRLKEEFTPAWQHVKRSLPPQIAAQCRSQGKSKDEFKREVMHQLRAQQKALLKQHRCAPFLTITGSLAAGIPLFLFVTFTIRTALMTKGLSIGNEVVPWWSPPAELTSKFEADAKVLAMRGMDAETLEHMIKIQGPTLAQVDKEMLAPVALGLATFTNVELGQWHNKTLLEITSTPKPDSGKSGAAYDDSEVQEEINSATQFRTRVMDNILRAAAIGFVVVAAQAPAGLVIYWTSSAVYTLLQSAAFAYIDQTRAKATHTSIEPPKPVSVVIRRANHSRGGQPTVDATASHQSR